MAVHDAKYFQAIYKSAEFYYKDIAYGDKLATFADVKVGNTNYRIFKYYDFRVLQHYAPSLSGYTIDDLIKQLYNFRLHPNQEPPELTKLLDEKNPQVFLSEESTKEREDINNLPPKEQAAAVKEWVSKQAPPSAPKQPKIVRVPKEKTEKAEEEAEETEEVSKDQVAQQPQEQPPPAQPSQPAAPPSMPQVPSPGISIPRRVPLSRETEEAGVGARQRVARAPGFFRRGLGGLGRRIAPGVGGLGNFALSNGSKLANFGADSIGRLNRLRFSTASNLKKATSRRVILILLLALGGFGLISGLQPGGILNPTGQQNQVKITKTGDPVVANGAQISYQITVTYIGSGTADIGVVDPIPENTNYIKDSGSNSPILEPPDNPKIIRWQLKGLLPNQPKILSFKVLPTENDAWVINNNYRAIITSSTGSGKGLISVTSGDLVSVFNQATNNAGIPAALLMAIGRTERGGDFYDYSNEEVRKFSRVSWWEGLESEAPIKEDNHPDILRGYGFNTCQYRSDCASGADVRGAMQFELNTWNGIRGDLSFIDGHEPDRRNLTDIIFGAALLIKNRAQSLGRTPITWDEQTIRTVGRMYCLPAAGREPERIKTSACGWYKPGDLTYDDRVWNYYNEFLGKP